MLPRKLGGILILSVLILSGCTAGQMPVSEKPKEEALSIAAFFQTEDGSALQGGAACFSFAGKEHSYPLDGSGAFRVSGLPRNGDVSVTVFDQQQRRRSAMTLSFSQCAVIDATTDEDRVGHIAVRRDTGEVALRFVLKRDGFLQCTLWLTDADLPQKDMTEKGD